MANILLIEINSLLSYSWINYSLLKRKLFMIYLIQFSISSQFSSIWPIVRALSGTTTPSQSGPGNDGNEGVLHISQSSSITGTSPSDF